MIGYWGIIKLVIKNLFFRVFYFFFKSWIIGIDSFMDFKRIKCNRLKFWCFEINGLYVVGVENWEVITYLFWDKYFVVVDIL